MKVLLDTHVFLWLQTEPERLGPYRPLVEDVRNERLVSAVSSWEVAIKWAIGRLPLPEPPARWFPGRMRAIGATPVPVEHAHTLAVAGLPRHHGDPFDRLLVAQAQQLDVPLLSADKVFGLYDVELLALDR
jgi:PIN domain nuclease of toxin-antitoxin system